MYKICTQKTLEVQLVQQREHKHSEAYQHQRQALSEALHQLSVQSEEVHSLRSQVYMYACMHIHMIKRQRGRNTERDRMSINGNLGRERAQRKKEREI